MLCEVCDGRVDDFRHTGVWGHTFVPFVGNPNTRYIVAKDETLGWCLLDLHLKQVAVIGHPYGDRIHLWVKRLNGGTMRRCVWGWSNRLGVEELIW